MKKAKTIKFDEFMKGDYKRNNFKAAAIATAPAAMFVMPNMAAAQEVNNTFGNVHSAIMNAFDAGVVIVIIFAGASWALGHRSKAIEILIGVCCGYILARHAVDIRDFLKGI